MGESALHNAVRAGHGEVALLLLEYGADPSLVCSRGASAEEARTPIQEVEQRLKKGARWRRKRRGGGGK